MAQLLVNIDVDDLDNAEHFYCEAFALRPGRRFGRAALELLGAETPIYLLRKRGGTAPFEGAAAVRDFGRHWTPVHLDFAVDDLEAAVDRACRAGATQEAAIREAPWGRMALLADPFGHGVCLLQFSAAGYDAVATG